MSTSTSAGFRTSSIIASSMAAGVVLFWAVAWFLVGSDGGFAGSGALTPELTLWIWGALAVPGFGGALLFTRKATSLGEEGRRRGMGIGSRETGRPDVGKVQTYLIIAWALLEGPALVAGVFFLLNGSRTLMAAAAPVYLVGVVLTFPRRSWFGTRSGAGAETGAAGGADAS